MAFPCRSAHLRSRGEHGLGGSRGGGGRGSPPLARRARRAGGAGGQAGWLTSARAESTLRDLRLLSGFAISLLTVVEHDFRFVAVAQRV